MSSSSPSARRLSTPVMITIAAVGVILLGLTIFSVVREMTRTVEPDTAVEVINGQTVKVKFSYGEENVRLPSVRAPIPAADAEEPPVPEESQAAEDEAVVQPVTALENCLAEQAHEHLASLVPEGTAVEVTTPSYPSAPGGDIWGEITVDGESVALKLVEAGLAVVNAEGAETDEYAQQLREAQQAAQDAELGIFSTDADCTLPSRMAPILEELENLPEADLQAAQEQVELAEHLAELNQLRDTAQEAITMLNNIPTTGDSLPALAWGEAKSQYVDEVQNALNRLDELIQRAQDRRTEFGENRRRAELERQRSLENQRAEAQRSAEPEESEDQQPEEQENQQVEQEQDVPETEPESDQQQDE